MRIKNPCMLLKCIYFLSATLIPSLTFSGSSDFTAAPPFVATNVGKPNVVIALDISGSMKAVAYRDVAAGNWKSGLHDDFDPSYSYYGYFESNKMYSYDGAFAKQFFYEDASGNWSGNFLNWLTMRRMDVVRKVLVGGKIKNRSGEVIDGKTWYILEGQDEPTDYTFRKSYSNSSGYSPIANDEELLISNGKFAKTTGSGASIVQLSDKMEVGKISIDRDTADDDNDGIENSNWHSVSFKNTYATPPVVVVTGLMFNGSNQTVARARNVTTTGFEVHLEEWDYLDGNHTTEDVVFIVAADTTTTSHSISVDGANYKVAAGKLSTSHTTHSTKTTTSVIHSAGFPTNPVVFAGVSTYNDPTPVTTRLDMVTKTSFRVALQEEEAEYVNAPHGTEEIHWVSIEPLSGFSDYSGVAIEIGKTGYDVTHSWHTVNFKPSHFRDVPIIAVDDQSFSGGDTAAPRYGNGGITTDSFTVKMEEEKSNDPEVGHAAESIAFLAVETSTAYKIRLGLTSEPQGIIQQNSGSIRFGLAVYNYDHTRSPTSIYTGNKVHGGTFRPCYPDVSLDVASRTNFDICLDTHVKSPLSNIINVIEDHPLIWGTTPIAETLYDIKGYFSQTDHNRGSNSHTQWYDNGTEGITGVASDGDYKQRNSYNVNNDWDPYYYPEYGTVLPCAKSFVLHFNDGAPYTDFDGSTGHPTITNDGVGSSGQNEALDDLALTLRNGDCRTETGMPGHQEIISYYVYAALGEADSNNNSTKRMREAAVNGGFVDADDDNTPDPAHPTNFISYINTGNCTPNEWDEDGDCSPDTFYFASDGELLEQELNAAFESITARAATGGASSVIAASRSGEGAVFNAIFRPSVATGSDEVTWIGDVHALMIDDAGNLRQDDGDRVLEAATSDNYVDMCSFEEGDTKEVRIKLSSTLGARPTAVQTSSCAASVFDKTLFELQYLWSGADWLANLTDAQAADSQRSYASTNPGRYIIAGLDSDGNGLVKGSEVVNFLPSSFGTTTAGLISNSVSSASDVINFIRGKDISGYRSRQLNGKTMRLGDIIYSTPTVVGRPAENLDLIYGSTSYATFFHKYRYRRQVVYAGGNDGMLHAFNSGWYDPSLKKFKNAKGSSASGSSVDFALGTELWAYVPYNALAHLEYLTRPSYGSISSDHLYFMDLEPRIFDAKIFTPDSDHPGGWGTVLVVGSRLGGGQITVDANVGTATNNRTLRSSYTIFDITNPDVAPKLMLEFTHADLGFTTSIPAPIVAGSDSEGNGNWYLMLGSGADTNAAGFEDIKSTQQAKLFLLDLKKVATGSSTVLETAFGSSGIYTLPDSNSFVSDLTAVDFGLDNFTTDAVYFGTVSGNASGWGGKIYRIEIQPNTGDTQNTVSTWTPSLVYNAGRPVTAAVSASTDNLLNRWLHVGTGRFFTRTDNLDNSVNYYFGIKEPRNTSGAYTYTTSTALVDMTSTKVATGTGLLTSPPTLTPALPTGATIEDLEKRMKVYSSSTKYLEGWVRTLDAGERNFGAASVLGGTLTYTTYDPIFDECSIDGDASLYVLNMLTGTAGQPGIIASDGSPFNAFKIDLGSNPATSPSLHIGDGYDTKKKTKAIIQTSDGAITTVQQNNKFSTRSGEASWRQLQ